MKIKHLNTIILAIVAAGVTASVQADGTYDVTVNVNGYHWSDGGTLDGTFTVDFAGIVPLTDKSVGYTTFVFT